jgi:hypothetical protein
MQMNRTAAYAQLTVPTRYTSDPGVIDNPVEMALVKAEWEAYFAGMNRVLEKYPYSEEEMKSSASLNNVESK